MASRRMTSTLHIYPGPLYDAHRFLEEKLLELSKFSQGTVVALASNYDEFKVGRYKVILVGAHGLGGNYQLLKETFRQASVIKQQYGLDFVVCYDPLKTGLIGMLVKRKYACRFIVEVNGVYSSPVLYHEAGLRGVVKKWFYPKLQQYVIKRASAVKCLFEGQLDGFVIPEHIERRCFFDFTSIPPAKYRESGNYKLLSIGFPMHIKGMDLLIQAFNRLRDNFPEWELELMGHFSEEERVYMHTLAGDNPKINIKRPVDFSQIPGIIDSCDIFALASRSEAMGRVLIESMARSKARIGAHVDGIPTVINDQVDGFLFECGSIDDLESKLSEVMASEALRRRLGEAGYQRFITEFSVTQYGNFVELLYNDILASSHY